MLRLLLVPLAFTLMGLTAPQRQQLTELIRAAQTHRTQDPVKAFVLLHEAYRLEQMWNNNTFDGDGLSERALERFLDDILARDDTSLLRILRSPRVPVNDKLNLVRRLEQEVILNYPGRTW